MDQGIMPSPDIPLESIQPSQPEGGVSQQLQKSRGSDPNALTSSNDSSSPAYAQLGRLGGSTSEQPRSSQIVDHGPEASLGFDFSGLTPDFLRTIVPQVAQEAGVSPESLASSPSTKPLLGDAEGKESVIKGLCEQAIRRGERQCIWLCIPHNRFWIAKNVSLTQNGKPLAIYNLRKELTWWKRVSLKSAIGVQMAEVYFWILGSNVS